MLVLLLSTFWPITFAISKGFSIRVDRWKGLDKARRLVPRLSPSEQQKARTISSKIGMQSSAAPGALYLLARHLAATQAIFDLSSPMERSFKGGLIEALVCLAVTGRRRAVTILVNSFLLQVERSHSAWDSSLPHGYSHLAGSIPRIFTEHIHT